MLLESKRSGSMDDFSPVRPEFQSANQRIACLAVYNGFMQYTLKKTKSGRVGNLFCPPKSPCK